MDFTAMDTAIEEAIVELDATQLRVAPADQVVAEALDMEVPADEVGDLIMALIGWDAAVVAVAAAEHPRAPQVLLSLLSWLLV